MAHIFDADVGRRTGMRTTVAEDRHQPSAAHRRGRLADGKPARRMEALLDRSDGRLTLTTPHRRRVRDE